MGYRGLTLSFQTCGVYLGLGGQGGAGFASFLPRIGPAAGTSKAPFFVSLPCRVGATLQGPDCRHRTGKEPLGRQRKVFWPLVGVLGRWAMHGSAKVLLCP